MIDQLKNYLVHILNTNEFVARPTVLLTVKPCDAFVITKFTSYCDWYVAPVGVDMYDLFYDNL